VSNSVNKSAAAVQAKKSKVIVYGGNGFVGTHVAKCLSESNVNAVCLSRTGHKPIHLDKKLLASADSLICLVGSAPTPTFSKRSFEQKVFENGITNATAIKAAGEAGIKKVILLGAQILWPLRTNKFAYAKGKELALTAASEFSQMSDEHSAIVFQPGMIYGRRYLTNGKSIPLNLLLGPLPYIMPNQFVSVEKLATRIVEIALSDGAQSGELTIIKNSDI